MSNISSEVDKKSKRNMTQFNGLDLDDKWKKVCKPFQEYYKKTKKQRYDESNLITYRGSHSLRYGNLR